jgi:hypothetical protein
MLIGVFVNNQVGIGWTASWRPAHDYAGLPYRPSFNTFDAIYRPLRLRTKRFWPEFRAGIGVRPKSVKTPPKDGVGYSVPSPKVLMLRPVEPA